VDDDASPLLNGSQTETQKAAATRKKPARRPDPGQRVEVKLRRPQYFKQIFWVPGGALAASLDGSFVCDLANQIESEVPYDGHILGAVAGTQA
jgi:hypothetical protein